MVSLAHLAAQLTLVPRDTVALTASALSLLASIGVGLLSTVGHQRLLRASKLLVLYLLITGFRDILSISRPVAARPNYLEQITTTVGIVRLLLLLIECTSKRDIFLPQFKALPPIETSNFFSVALFWWINSLLMKGHKRMLQDDDIPALDSPLQAKGLNQSIKQSWSNRGKFQFIHACCASNNVHSNARNQIDTLQGLVKVTRVALHHNADSQNLCCRISGCPAIAHQNRHSLCRIAWP